jgi:hypothetical protein
MAPFDIAETTRTRGNSNISRVSAVIRARDGTNTSIEATFGLEKVPPDTRSSTFRHLVETSTRKRIRPASPSVASKCPIRGTAVGSKSEQPASTSPSVPDGRLRRPADALAKSRAIVGLVAAFMSATGHHRDGTYRGSARTFHKSNSERRSG